MASEVVRIDGFRTEEDLKSRIVAKHEVDEFWARSLGLSVGQAESKVYKFGGWGWAKDGESWGAAENFSITCTHVPTGENRSVLFAILSFDFITHNMGTSGPGGAIGPQATAIFKDGHDGVIWEWVMGRFSQGCRITEHYSIRSDDQLDFYSLIEKVDVQWSASYWIRC